MTKSYAGASAGSISRALRFRNRLRPGQAVALSKTTASDATCESADSAAVKVVAARTLPLESSLRTIRRVPVDFSAAVLQPLQAAMLLVAGVAYNGLQHPPTASAGNLGEL